MDPLSATEDRVFECVDALADEMIEFCQELVRIPTVNPPGSHYRECAALIGERLGEFGYDVEYLEADGHPVHTRFNPRVNVVGRLEGSRKRPCLHFNGHLDVVPEGNGWNVDPFGGELRDGRIYGRGACDQKAGIAASIYAVEALRRAGIRLRGAVEQSATVDEESGGYAGVADLCDRGVIRRGRQDYVVITEPLNYDRVCIGHRGVLWLEITTGGRIAHGSMPDYGVNAADAMAEVIHAINSKLRPKLGQRTTEMPVVPEMARHATLNLNALHGGQDIVTEGFLASCVADRCVAVYDRRYLQEENPDDVWQEISDLLSGLTHRLAPVSLGMRKLWTEPPVMTPRNARIVTTMEAAIESVLWRPAEIVASPGTYDHKHVARRAGIVECIAYGPGILELAHQRDEYVEIDHLVTSAKVMASAAMRLLGVSPALPRAADGRRRSLRRPDRH